MDIIDFPTQRKLPTRSGAIRANVVHTTGETDLDKILKFYGSPDGYQPHYMIETIGTIRRIVSEDLVAYHAAHHPAEAAAYAKGWSSWSTCRWDGQKDQAVPYGGFFPGYTGWNTMWRSRGLSSPTDLITGTHPNLVSIGIELQQPTDDLLTPDIFTDAQYASLKELLADINTRRRVPLDRDHNLGHYDVGPMRRTTEKSLNGWDPGGKFNWTRVFDVAGQAV